MSQCEPEGSHGRWSLAGLSPRAIDHQQGGHEVDASEAREGEPGAGGRSDPSVAPVFVVQSRPAPQEVPGESYQKLDESDLANRFYSEAAKFPMTYYGQLAFNKINPGGNFQLTDQSFYSPRRLRQHHTYPHRVR